MCLKYDLRADVAALALAIILTFPQGDGIFTLGLCTAGFLALYALYTDASLHSTLAEALNIVPDGLSSGAAWKAYGAGKCTFHSVMIATAYLPWF